MSNTELVCTRHFVTRNIYIKTARDYILFMTRSNNITFMSWPETCIKHASSLHCMNFPLYLVRVLRESWNVENDYCNSLHDPCKNITRIQHGMHKSCCKVLAIVCMILAKILQDTYKILVRILCKILQVLGSKIWHDLSKTPLKDS